jgi:chromosome segregation ATPase
MTVAPCHACDVKLDAAASQRDAALRRLETTSEDLRVERERGEGQRVGMRRLEDRVRELEAMERTLDNEVRDKGVALGRLEMELRESQRALAELEREKGVLSMTRDEKDKMLNDELRAKEELKEYLGAVKEEVENLREDIKTLVSEKRQLVEDMHERLEAKEEETRGKQREVDALSQELSEERDRTVKLMEDYANEKRDMEDRYGGRDQQTPATLAYGTDGPCLCRRAGSRSCRTTSGRSRASSRAGHTSRTMST